MIYGGDPGLKSYDHLLEIGKKYNCYDDGKIRPSRHCIAEIKEIISFDEFKERFIKEGKTEELNKVLEDIERCDWLYKPLDQQDKVIIAEMSGGCCNDEDPTDYFFRTVDGRCKGWFSANPDGWWSAELDTDGSLTESLIKDLDEYFDYPQEEKIKILNAFV